MFRRLAFIVLAAAFVLPAQAATPTFGSAVLDGLNKVCIPVLDGSPAPVALAAGGFSQTTPAGTWLRAFDQTHGVRIIPDAKFGPGGFCSLRLHATRAQMAETSLLVGAWVFQQGPAWKQVEDKVAGRDAALGAVVSSAWVKETSTTVTIIMLTEYPAQPDGQMTGRLTYGHRIKPKA